MKKLINRGISVWSLPTAVARPGGGVPGDPLILSRSLAV